MWVATERDVMIEHCHDDEIFRTHDTSDVYVTIACDLCLSFATTHIIEGSAHQWYCDKHGEATIDEDYPWYWESV